MLQYYKNKLILKVWMWCTLRVWPTVAFYTPNGKNEVKGMMVAHSQFHLSQMAFSFVEESPEAKVVYTEGEVDVCVEPRQE